jgi:serpin B
MKKTVLVIIGLLVIFSSKSQDLAKQIENNNQFTFELYKYLNVSADNVFISPFSVSTALAMTYEGSAGTTKDQMVQYLHFSADKKVNLKNYYDILNNVQSKKDDKNYILNIANSLWFQKEYNFLLSYFDNVRAYYNAPVVPVDYKDPANRETARKQINDWTAKKTNDKIKNLIGEGVLSDRTRLVLINAVYFLSQWQTSFKKEDTKQDVFYALDGQTKKDFMHLSTQMSYAESEGVKLIEIPYSENRASMIILLPDKNTFPEFFKAINLAYFTALYDKRESVSVNLVLPKFKIEYKEDLANTLKQAGMTLPFMDGADFSDMSVENNLKIDKIIHQTFINVDESGTEAAAATAVIMNTKSMNTDKTVDFIANRPFLFLIRDNASGSIIFLGHLVK